MIQIRLDLLNEKQRGIYCVPGKVIIETEPCVPSIYLGLMRYTNTHNEIVSSVRMLAEFACLKPIDKKDGINMKTRRAIKTLRNLGLLSSYGFDKYSFNVKECFMLKFTRSMGWAYAYTNQAFGCGYIKEAELEKLRRKFLLGERDYVTSFVSAIQFLLYARLFMERPAGRLGFKQIEEGASAILTEEQIVNDLSIKPKTISRRLGSMARYGLLDSAVRYVRENKKARQQKMFILVNKTKESKKTIRVADRALKKIFAEVTPLELKGVSKYDEE